MFRRTSGSPKKNATVKSGFRNIDGWTMGEAVRVCHQAKQNKRAKPATISVITTRGKPRPKIWMRLNPRRITKIPASSIVVPSQSNLPGLVCSDGGSTQNPRPMAARPKGALIKNINGHPKVLRNSPPYEGTADESQRYGSENHPDRFAPFIFLGERARRPFPDQELG
ncbi:MAG: hypothetical protein Ct9H300mP8_05410 [Gammaproteobacteria bacterium]|nr:MAG: hypothetical protein Ct9H300mP8_05410 [Gammaproteobacteria bacterium]